MATMERRGMIVCHECMLMLRRTPNPSQWRTITPAIRQWTGRSYTTATQFRRDERQHSSRQQTPKLKQTRRITSNAATSSPDLGALHTRIISLSSTALKPEDTPLPSEQRILYVLEHLDAIARTLIDAKTVAGAAKARQDATTATSTSTATSALLGSVNARQYPAFLSKAALLNLISQTAEEMMRHPNIFITPAVLKSYVELQSLLHQPSSFPDVFALYASKPVPKLSKNNSSIEYTPTSPSKLNAAIPVPTANTALTSAMTAHDLPLSLSIINTTFSTQAFHRNKLLRQALLPSSLLLSAPLIAYAASQQFSLLQQTMSPAYAQGVAFAGIMTYISTVCGLGYVVVTTANDQMDRITWAKGVPLWERWVREEERAALDRVAGKWGFGDVERRGEEEGGEWEVLREAVGLRGMVLDRSELMEGME